MGFFSNKPPAAPVSAPAPQPKTVTVLGTEFELVGDLSSSENVQAEGRVKGNGDVRGTITVGSDCTWEGNITADFVVVKGKVQGNISAHKKLDLLAGARVTGDITAPAISMDVGAICEGQVHMQEQAGLASIADRQTAS